MSIWFVILAIGAITFATRLSFILLFERMEIPDWLRRSLRFVPAAVLSAIIFPELLVREGMVSLSLENPRLVAGILAALVAWRTRNVLFTLAAGMAALFVLQAIFG